MALPGWMPAMQHAQAWSLRLLTIAARQQSTAGLLNQGVTAPWPGDARSFEGCCALLALCDSQDQPGHFK